LPGQYCIDTGVGNTLYLSPTPETTFLLFFADGTVAGLHIDGFVIANGPCGIEVRGRRCGRELRVEGIEDADRRIAGTTILLFSGVLV
jgi:hypothetical protein